MPWQALALRGWIALSMAGVLALFLTPHWGLHISPGTRSSSQTSDASIAPIPDELPLLWNTCRQSSNWWRQQLMGQSPGSTTAAWIAVLRDFYNLMCVCGGGVLQSSCMDFAIRFYDQAAWILHLQNPNETEQENQRAAYRALEDMLRTDSFISSLRYLLPTFLSLSLRCRFQNSARQQDEYKTCRKGCYKAGFNSENSAIGAV